MLSWVFFPSVYKTCCPLIVVSKHFEPRSNSLTRLYFAKLIFLQSIAFKARPLTLWSTEQLFCSSIFFKSSLSSLLSVHLEGAECPKILSQDHLCIS